MSPRLGAKTIEAKGIFPRAEVTRGHDWLWGDQDGKNSVVIITRQNYALGVYSLHMHEIEMCVCTDQ